MKPAASTGTRPKRSIARPAGSAASAPEASTIAGPSPSRPLTPSTATSVSDATAADSCSIPELAARAADSSAVLRRIGRSGGDAHAAQRYPPPWHHRAVATTPPARGLRAIDPTPFRLRLEREPEPRPASAAAGLAAVLADLDRRIRPFGRGFGAPWAARRAHGLLGGFRWDDADSRTKAWYPQGIAASPDGERRARLLVPQDLQRRAHLLRRPSPRPLPPCPPDRPPPASPCTPTRAGWRGTTTCST